MTQTVIEKLQERICSCKTLLKTFGDEQEELRGKIAEYSSMPARVGLYREMLSNLESYLINKTRELSIAETNLYDIRLAEVFGRIQELEANDES